MKFTIEIEREMSYIILCKSLFIFSWEVLFYGS